MKNFIQHFSAKLSTWAGSANAMAFAAFVIAIWIISGPVMHFSNTWLIDITVVTDLIVFMMVFSIQNTQNRDSKAVQLKLNELIVANNNARDTFIGLESLTDEELEDIDDEFQKLLDTLDSSHALHKLHKRISKEKAHRTGDTNGFTTTIHKTEEIVSAILNPLGDKK